MTTPSNTQTALSSRLVRLPLALSLLVVAVACGGGGGGGGSGVGGGSGSAAPSDPASELPAPGPGSLPQTPPTLGDPRNSARIFFSGHSLTDNPLPEYVTAIAQSLRATAWWNQQNILGSTIAARTRGNDASGTAFPGYSQGKNRVGSGMNVVSELRQPQTIEGQRYDTLILTERHDIVNTIIWENTVAYARHFHDRLIEGNAQASTYLYHSWMGLPDMNAPQSWVSFERAVAPAWQCVAARVNESLALVGRNDRVVYLPAGLALASLVEQATQGSGVAGVTGASVRETVDRLFSDDVHLTPMGVYYMALVNYASVYRQSPVGAWAPSGVTATQARSLQDVAWQAVTAHFTTYSPPDNAQCRAVMRDSVCPAFYNFVNRADQIGACSTAFSGMTQSNPFYFNASTDSTKWLPAP